MLFNQWKVWWGNKPYIQFELWTILWPFFFVIGIVSASYTLIKTVKMYFLNKTKILKNNLLFQAIIFISIWIFLSTSYLSCLPISPRYLMILYFPIYIIIPLMLKLISDKDIIEKRGA